MDWLAHIYIIFLFLLIFLVIIHFIEKHVVKNNARRKLKSTDISLLRWRVSICFTVLLISLILFLNRESLIAALGGELNVFLMVALLIFFVSFIGIIIIDLLLPASIKLWKRIAIETSLFLVLCLILIALLQIT